MHSTGVFLLVLSFAFAKQLMVIQVSSEGFRTGYGDNPLNTTWAPGPNEILPMGLRQHYLVGYDLKESVCAGMDLEAVYSPHQIYIRSTNQNMTLMSAQAELEGVLPPEVRGKLTQDQADRAKPPTNLDDIEDIITSLGLDIMPNEFQVAPVHAYAKEKDTVLRKEWCPHIASLQTTAVTNTEWVTATKQKYNTPLTALWNYAGKFDEIDLAVAAGLADGVNALFLTKTNLPAELNNYRDELQKFLAEYQQQQWTNGDSVKLMVTNLYKTIEGSFNIAKDQAEGTLGEYFKQKLQMYFSNIELIQALQLSLGLSLGTNPTKFASTFLFLFTEDVKDVYSVQIKFNKELVDLKSPCTGTSCEMSKFFEYLNSLTYPDDTSTVCSTVTLTAEENNTLIHSAIATTSVLLAVGAFFMMIRKKVDVKDAERLV